MKTYFNIKYEFDVDVIHQTIDKLVELPNEPHYIPVVDGVVMSHANSNLEYRKVISEGVFSICDSSYVPVYLKWIYGVKYRQYCGSDIFMDIINMKKYRMFFMGAFHETLQGLKKRLVQIDERINDMPFYELPYKDVDNFDYMQIAEILNSANPDIIWVALGAPKQEMFMNRLKPYLKRGIMISVGAVFKFYSGHNMKRAPEWFIKRHLEFAYRIVREPRKQVKRCAWIISLLPRMLWEEWRKAKSIRKNRI